MNLSATLAIVAIILSVGGVDLFDGPHTARHGITTMPKHDPEIAETDFPPLSPAGEQAGPDDRAFVTECLSQLDRLGALGRIQAGKRRLTISKEWGPVFRVDFTIDQASNDALVDRLVCWKQQNGSIGTTYAIGQNIAPLT